MWGTEDIQTLAYTENDFKIRNYVTGFLTVQF